ncbi:hypothetical protein CV102_14750 [Natronococcus pandeyae]|uniref:Uncharacterized protein n=1 Tax=Natronococcus pandeyae TaxID=2055836 RepID=A0A8J8TRQ7_9EURY|nr:hypothetical protein CV102_14750 [Natronococcus pandeyae]
MLAEVANADRRSLGRRPYRSRVAHLATGISRTLENRPLRGQSRVDEVLERSRERANSGDRCVRPRSLELSRRGPSRTIDDPHLSSI